MDQFLPPILEWISTTHGSGRHEYYGWVVVLIFATSIAKRLSKSEKAENKKTLRAQQIEFLRSGSLVAVIYSEDNQVSVSYTASIEEGGEGYRIMVREIKAAEESLLINEAAKTLEAIESIIKEKTLFSISDFRPVNCS